MEGWLFMSFIIGKWFHRFSFHSNQSMREIYFVLRLRLMIPLSFFSLFDKWMDLWKGKSPLLEKPRLPQIRVKEVDGPETDSPRIFSWNISPNIVTQASKCIVNWREIICWVDVIGAGVASVQLRWKCEIGWNPSVGTRFTFHSHQSLPTPKHNHRSNFIRPPQVNWRRY